ncbi:hypothetical protein B0H34DRAFT_782739 [Crassisporium funariophilum]|nr:hypothetical protein B0H34DRAFT_782739 [Crassisporium funariophilum]
MHTPKIYQNQPLINFLGYILSQMNPTLQDSCAVNVSTPGNSYLLTFQHNCSLQESRSEESTPWRRLQGTVFVMGLFHLKMASARTDKNSLMAHDGEIRPKETGKIEMKPGFRRMHEVIQHVGIASQLDIWRTTRQTTRNSLLCMQYFLLYEEISHAMNTGDIGCVEVCFLPWMMILAGCGKHKYATEMQHYLENIHFIYSKKLRMNILCNPTGKPGEFCALDWVVEHNNLYIKRIYGGKYLNHQKSRILAESPLIETYKNIRLQFKQMFCLNHKTSRHAPPKMQITFKKLTAYMEREKAHVFVANQDSGCSVPDMMEKGINILMTRGACHADAGGDVEDPELAELGDEMEEVEVWIYSGGGGGGGGGG